MRRPIAAAAARNASSEDMPARERRLEIRRVDRHAVARRSGRPPRRAARRAPRSRARGARTIAVGEQRAAARAEALARAGVLGEPDAWRELERERRDRRAAAAPPAAPRRRGAVSRSRRKPSAGRYRTAASQRSRRNGWSATFSRNGTPRALSRDVSARTSAGSARATRCSNTRAPRPPDELAPVDGVADAVKNPGESAGSSFGKRTLTRRPGGARRRRAAVSGRDARAQARRRHDRLARRRGARPSTPAPSSRAPCSPRTSRRQPGVRGDRLRLAPARRHRPTMAIERRSRAPRAGTRRDSARRSASLSSASNDGGQRPARAAQPRVSGRPADRHGPRARAATCSR